MNIKNILVGEDIRLEQGNKLSLMGIFGGVINLAGPQEIPPDAALTLFLACLVTIENKEIKPLKDHSIVITMALGGEDFSTIKAAMDQAPTEPLFHLPIPRFPISVVSNVDLTITVAIFKKDRKLTEEKFKIAIMLHCKDPEHTTN